MASGRSRNYVVDVLVALILVSSAYLAYKLVPYYIDQYRLKNDVRDVIVATTRSTDMSKLKESIRDVAWEYGLELARDDVSTEMVDQVISVYFEYDRRVAIPLTDKEILLHFEVSDKKDVSIW